MTRIVSLVTGSNLENRWPQRDIRFALQMWKPAQVAQAVTKAKKNRKKKRGRSTIYDPKPSKKLLLNKQGPLDKQQRREAGSFVDQDQQYF